MIPWILGSAALGGALGGVKGYQGSGGDLGSTLGGAATGALLGGVTGGLGAGAGGLAAGRMAKGLPIEMLLKKQGMGLGLTGIEKAMLAAPGVIGGAANIGTQLASGALLAPVAGAVSNLAGQAVGRPANAAAQAAAGVLGTQGPGAVNYDAMGNPLPSGLGQFGGVAPYGTALDVINPLGYGAGRTAEALREATAQRDSMRMLLPEIAKASEFRSKQELARQMAAAGIRQNIATAANMLERSQQAAQQMGVNAASQAGSALTSQYQYQ